MMVHRESRGAKQPGFGIEGRAERNHRIQQRSLAHGYAAQILARSTLIPEISSTWAADER
jgi:hypothetical protein